MRGFGNICNGNQEGTKESKKGVVVQVRIKAEDQATALEFKQDLRAGVRGEGV